jgi:hypothetical protein
VDQSVSIRAGPAPGTQHPGHAINCGLRVSEPLKCPLGPDGVEGRVGLVERQGVTEDEAHGTPRGARSHPGDAEHLRALVDPDDLAAAPEELSQVDGCVAETAADIEKAVAFGQAEVSPLERSELSRCVPRPSDVHGAKQHSNVLVAVDIAMVGRPRAPRPGPRGGALAGVVRRLPLPDGVGQVGHPG